MDAEFFARRGAYVITADVSFEAARRARERAQQYGVEMTSIVADAEHLPFADHSIDLAYVHDGLHHLATPVAGLAEMARVSRRAVSINEPARAVITEWAVRLRIAQEVEEAGNRVARLDPHEVASELRARGFDVVGAERYAMFYRHQPGLPTAALSLRPIFPLARAVLRVTNMVLGRFGNKLTVQAVRKA
jgi:ubiquinone/menaquinone biosynthesis C-methylase UbiE